MSSLNDAFAVMSKKIDGLINELEVLKVEMADFHRRCNVARGIGTAFTIAGTVATTAASAGSAAPVALPISLMIGGWVTNVLTKLVDNEETTKCVGDIKKIVRELADAIEAMEPIINYIARAYPNEGSEASVLAASRARIGKAFENLRKILDESVPISNLENIAFARVGIFPQLFLGMMGGGTLGGIAIGSSQFPVIHDLFSSFPHYYVCLNVVFQLVEVIVLIRSCMRKHVTVEMIDDIVKKLKDMKVDYQRILDQFIRVNRANVYARVDIGI